MGNAAADKLSQWYQQLNGLKDQVSNGQLSLVEYQSQANPIIKQAWTLAQQSAQSGSGNASASNPVWQQFTDNNFATFSGGKLVPSIPFSRQEYAKLPNNVLPTQGDIDKGMFDPTGAPLQRLQTPGGGSTNGPIVSNPTAPTTDPSGNPLPQVNPQLPPGTDTSTDQGKIALQGAQNASQLQDALNKQYDVNKQAVSQLGQSLAGIPDIYRTEGNSQQQQLQALADQQKSARAQSLTDLGGILATNQQNLFNRAIPDLAEQANTRGIYRSTGFGDMLANKYANLTQDTQTQLALQGLNDRESYLGQQSNALNTQLGFSGQGAQAQASGQQAIGSAGAGALQAYGSGLGDVANAQIGMQNAGLQRNFSLQDYATQYQNALNLANQAKTQGPTGKNSPNTQAWIQGSGALLSTGASLAGGSGGNAGQGKGSTGPQNIGGGNTTMPGYSPY